MQSILETCVPREDILTGTFNPEIFTASLSQVVEHYRGQNASIRNLYTDAESFFREATYPTYGMRTVVSEVLARLTGDTGVPAIHRLETAFGGGKTHTLIALTHLAYRNQDLAQLANDIVIEGIFDPSQLYKLHGVDVVGIAGDEIPVRNPKEASLVPYTLWGEIAYQLGGETLYRTVEDDVTSYAAPGKDYLKQLFQGRRVLIMLDEFQKRCHITGTRRSRRVPNRAHRTLSFSPNVYRFSQS